MSAEYVLSGGNTDVILCERGIRTFETATRNTFDISAIAVVKKLSHLSVVADPSHGAGRRDMVAQLARAAVAAGADGAARVGALTRTRNSRRPPSKGVPDRSLRKLGVGNRELSDA